jgi:GAF domain-containing protein/HAMP domain-containing protein
MFKDRYSALSKIEQRIFWITLLLSIILFVVAGSLFDTFLQAPNLPYRIVSTIPFILGVFSFISAILIFLRKNEQSSWLMLFGGITILPLIVSQLEGYGFPAALLLLVITLFVSLQLPKGQKAVTALVIGVAGTVIIILVDTFWSLPRVPAWTEDVVSGRIASIILCLIILTAVTLQYRDLSIRAKLLILAIGTGLTSIILVAGFATYFTQQALTQKTKDALISAAHHTIDQVDEYIHFTNARLSSEAKIPMVIDYLKANPEERESAQEEILALFQALSQSDPVNISSYALLDRNGIDLVDTSTQDIGLNKSDRDYFIIPMTMASSFVSPVRYSPTTAEHAFYISTPVYGNNGSFLGVLRVRIRASLLSQILQTDNGFAGEGSYGIMLDENHLVIAHGTNSDWISHLLVKPDQAVVDQLRAQNRLPDLPLNRLALEMPLFAQSIQDLRAGPTFFSSMESAWGTTVEVGAARSLTTPWKVAYVQPQSIAFRAVLQQRQIIVVIALLTGALIALAGFAVAGTMTRPISLLASTAEQIAAGDLSARAALGTGDEINTLAVAFNSMTDRLKETLEELEHRVSERTADLELARRVSERRARELQSIGEISSLITSEQSQDTLLTLITRLVSEKFNYYHVGIFFLDSTGQYAVLQAANSQGGQRMLVRGHRLEVGQTGIVGNVAKTGEARIALDVGEDAAYFDNPDLPMTRSEMALPLKVHSEIIGVLDIQSTEPGVFTDNDTKTLSILADQIAIAIDNARLFGQNKQSLEELQSLYNQYLRQEWKTFIHNRPHIGYVQSVVSGRPIEVPVESEEIRQALADGQVVVLEANEKSLPSIAVPVKLRGQTIGILRIQAPTKNRIWNQDEINLAQAISDRLALALDNARLLFVSQRQTAKEQKIGEVTAKIGASMNMRNVLQTAVEELGRALPGSEVLIQFQSNGKQG